MKIKKNRIIIIILVTVICIGCSNKKEHEIYQFFKSKEINIDYKQYNIFLLIPQNGCSPCIGKAKKYMIDALNKNKKVLFIIHNYRTKKELRNYYDLDIENNKNIIVDETDFFIKKNYSIKYPVALILHKDSVQTIVISPNVDDSIYYTFD